MANNRITKALSWRDMKEAYKIGTVRVAGKLVQVNELADAIAAGEVKELLEQCANELHSGDFTSAVSAFRRNIQSQASNMRNGKIAYTTTDMQRYELLDAYTKQFVETAANAVIAGKAKWQYTLEDIEALAGNHEELRKLYNSMMDKKSKDPEAILEVTTMEEYTARVDRVRVLRNEAAEATDKKVPDTIIDKLLNNKKLTAEEAAMVAKVLGK